MKKFLSEYFQITALLYHPYTDKALTCRAVKMVTKIIIATEQIATAAANVTGDLI